MCALSDRVQVVETQLESAAQTPSSSGSEFESPMGRCKRRIPLELQVFICVHVCTVESMLYTSLHSSALCRKGCFYF